MTEPHAYTPRRRPTLRDRAEWFAQHGTNVPQQIRLQGDSPVPTLVLFGFLGCSAVAWFAIAGALVVGDKVVAKWTGARR